MILLPSSPSIRNDGKRDVITLNFTSSNIQKDFTDTKNNFIVNNSGKVVISAVITPTGFSIDYVTIKDATNSEIVGMAGLVLQAQVVNLGKAIVQTAVNFSQTFSISGMWDDLKKLFAEFAPYVIIFVILIIVLVIWTRR